MIQWTNRKASCFAYCRTTNPPPRRAYLLTTVVMGGLTRAHSLLALLILL